MIEDLDRVVLTRDIPEKKLKAGDVGTVVMVYKDGEAFEVEFMTLDGGTFALATPRISALMSILPSEPSCCGAR